MLPWKSPFSSQMSTNRLIFPLLLFRILGQRISWKLGKNHKVKRMEKHCRSFMVAGLLHRPHLENFRISWGLQSCSLPPLPFLGNRTSFKDLRHYTWTSQTHIYHPLHTGTWQIHILLFQCNHRLSQVVLCNSLPFLGMKHVLV